MTQLAPLVISPTSASLPPVSNVSVGKVPVTGIQHKTVPNNLPLEHLQTITDYNSSTTAKSKTVTDGDLFTFGQFERPFNANTMNVYFPYLDIQNATIFQDDILTTVTNCGIKLEIFGSLVRLENDDPTSTYARDFERNSLSSL
jgi:hypothetical protein